MRSGTPGFNGARLREAREVRGLTAVALSELADVSTQSISQYEKKKASPSPEALARLAGALKFSEHFFILPDRDYQRGTTFYRSMSSTTKGARARAEHRFTWLRDITLYLAEFVAFPKANFPEMGLPEDPLLISDDEIELAAERLRTYWGMRDGPIANMVLLLENQGAIVARDKLGAETLDGLSEWAVEDKRPYVIVGTDKGTPARWRFDAAHELGHVILHAKVRRQDLSRPEHFKRIEQQAHRFASAFLLPLSAFGDDLFGVSLDAFRSIKPKWKTSIGMMIMRARQGGFLTEESEKKLWINYSRRGWRKLEPFDDTMNHEEPRLLPRAFEMVLREGAQTPEDVVTHLGLPAFDVEALSGLSPNFLSRFSRVALRDEENGNRTGDVIPLRPRTS